MSTTKVSVSFWRIFWPSLIASMILSLLGWIFWLIVLGGLFSETPEIKQTAVLHLQLNGEIAERADKSFNSTTFAMNNKIGLAELIKGLDEAAADKSVKGLYLELGNVSCGYATAYELRQAIHDFTKSGKFVVAYLTGEMVTKKQYYIASAASEVYGFENTAMEFVGLGAELMFFKKTFDKLGLEMQVIRGSNNDFKSAVEPYFRENMSDSSRLQVNRYLQSIWNDMVKDIAKDRKLPAAKLNDIAENVRVARMDDALKYKLIDGIKYRDEVEELVAKKAELKDLSQLMAFEKYAKKVFDVEQMNISTDEANVAVVTAEGAISVDGDEMTSKEICKHLREVRLDKNIKAVVFRINSPGGSALASEEIWREANLIAQSKTLVVSMGDLAASGGYYIATPAETIFAEPTTITGSIGVFGVIPFTGAMLENNLGLTFDRVQTHSHSVLSLNRRLSPDEMARVQNEVDAIYSQFKKRVADGRGMTSAQVEVVARGRVWTGTDALRIGLVDKIGGLQDALAYATKAAKVKEAVVRHYPKVKEDPFAEIIEKIEEQESDATMKIKRTKTPKVIDEALEKFAKLDAWTGIQMRMPYEIIFR
ncbi:MAG: signal peptide peptidase SppA [Fluviicola sp.]